MFYKIANATVRTWPFPHLCIEDFLDWDLYRALIEDWPDDRFQDISKIRPVSGYKDRSAWHFKDREDLEMQGPWLDLYDLMHHPAVRNAMMTRLDSNRVPETCVTDSLLVRDRGGYSIGPHTDAPQKVCSGLLYLQSFGNHHRKDGLDETPLGTSLYISRTGKTCPGGPHHDRDSAEFQFEEVWRAPYQPNTFVCFLKTDNSFHGVEPVPEGYERRVYIWNVRTSEIG
jgi:hypothetical protein